MKKNSAFAENELREIAQAYFSLTTREMIECEILLIRAGLDFALPHILNAALKSLQFQASTRKMLETRLAFDDQKKRFMDYMWAKSSLDDTIDHAFDVCKRFGPRSEELLTGHLRNAAYKKQLLSTCILYKFTSLSTATMAKIKSMLSVVSVRKPESSLYIILLLLLNKAGDFHAKEIVRKRVQESGYSEEKILEDSFLLVLIDLASGITTNEYQSDR